MRLSWTCVLAVCSLLLGCGEETKTSRRAPLPKGTQTTQPTSNQTPTPTPASQVPPTTTTTPSPTPTAPEQPATPANTVSFAKDIRPLMTKYCEGSGCHTGPDPDKSPALSSYDEVKKGYSKSLKEIQKGGMPRSRPDMSASEINQFKVWGETGFQP